MRAKLQHMLVCGLGVAVALLLSAQAALGQARTDTGQERIADFKAAGPQATLTIYPVQVQGKPSRETIDALGLALETFGMDHLEAMATAFTPPAGTTWEQLPTRFAEFIRQNEPTTSYALYAEYLGDPKTGPTEIRWVLTDASGNLIFADRQTPTDPDFKRTAAQDPDPMGCSVLVAERLFAQTGWTKRSGPARPEGKFARIWAEKSLWPTEAEREAMTKRLNTLKGNIKTARIGVFATRVNAAIDAESAARLAKQITERIGSPSFVVAQPMATEIQPTSNEQRRLWDLARAFREHVRGNPIDADYALMADFLLDADANRVHSVHFVLCDKAGEWVIVDFQNNQQADFKRIAPKNVADCEKLAVTRMEGMVK